MLRIAHISTTIDTGGAETMLLRLVSKMDKSRFENSVFSILGEGKLAGAVRETGTRVYCAGLNTRFPNPLLLRKLIRQIRDYRPDIIQTWLYHADFVGSLAGKLGGKAPVIWNLRCSEPGPEDSSWSLRRLIALLARWSPSSPTAVIVNSISGKASHEAIGYRPRRWEVIPNGFDMARYPHDETARMSARKILGVDGSVPLVGIVGRHAPIKEHGVFLEGASLLLKTVPNCRFALVGKGLDKENRKLMGQIESLGLAKAVSLMGERPDATALMAAFDVGALTSRSEGFPNVVAEMMACGVPCVVTDVGDAAEIVGEFGAVIARGDAMALAREWGRLLAMPRKERVKLGEGARDRIGTRYSIERVVGEYERLYESVAACRD